MWPYLDGVSHFPLDIGHSSQSIFIHPADRSFLARSGRAMLFGAATGGRRWTLGRNALLAD
jgi:hypothetical protein